MAIVLQEHVEGEWRPGLVEEVGLRVRADLPRAVHVPVAVAEEGTAEVAEVADAVVDVEEAVVAVAAKHALQLTVELLMTTMTNSCTWLSSFLILFLINVVNLATYIYPVLLRLILFYYVLYLATSMYIENCFLISLVLQY